MNGRYKTLLDELAVLEPGRKLNDEQLEAVFSDDSTVVSAGAGSGKTTVLSLRFLRLLMERKAHSDEILTLTFTRKAALEMSQRINDLVFRSAAVSEEDRRLMSQAQISTLDSFTSLIVRSDSAHYGIARDFSQDAGQSGRRDRLVAITERFLADKSCGGLHRALAGCYSPDTLADEFTAAVDRAVVITGSYDAHQTADWLKGELSDRFSQLKTELHSLLSSLAGAKAEENRALALQYIENLERNECLVCPSSPFNKRKAADEDKEAIDAFRQLWEEYNSLQGFLFSGSSSLLQQAVQKIASLLIEEKRRTSMLSFSDTMALALDILKRNTGLRQYFKTRYKYIMIDEFQDNNSLQRDLLFLLAERNDLCIEGRIPETDELEKGKLFFVGDEKQSIYLFRGADVSVFRSLQDDISSSGGRSLRLSTNYRSCRCLIDHFNTVFRSVFASSEKDYEARFEETRAGRAGDEGGSVSLLAIDRELAASRYPDLTPAEAEAENVALLVERMLTGDEFLVRGRRPQETDIAILFARSGNQVSYELALKRRGISYQVGINKSLMQQAVSGDFYSLLQSIVYPDDRIALAASLRGPFARLSDRTADQILSSGPESLDGKDRERYQCFSAFRDRVAEMVFAVPVAQVLSYMYYEGGYFALLSSREDYLGFEEHFEYLLSYAESYEKNGGLTSFLSFLRSNLGSQDRIDETRVLHEKKQGVQIMTVHAAKGLEFPIVIVASSASRPAADRKNYVFSYKGRLIAADDGALYRVLDRDRQARQEAESMRTLYVALTRAECHLVVSGTVKLTAKGGLDGNTAKSFARYLDAVGYDPAAGVCRNAKVKVIAPALSFARERKGRGGSLESLERLAASYEEKSFVSRPLTAKPSSMEDEPCGDLVRLACLPSDSLHSDDESSDFGTAVHSYLEYSLTGRDPEEIFSSSFFSGPEGRQMKEDVRKLAGNFLSSRFFSQHKDRPRWCEYRFFSYSEEADCVWEGVTDLLIDAGDRMLVVDYKTDRTCFEGKHRQQLVTYIRAVEKLFSKPCTGAVFYLRKNEIEPFWDRDGKVCPS